MIQIVPTTVVAILVLSVTSWADQVGYPSTNRAAISAPAGPGLGRFPRTASLDRSSPTTTNVYPQTGFGLPAPTRGELPPQRAAPAAANPPAAAAIQGQLVQAGKVVAIVGGETILAGDLEAEILAIRERIGDQATDEQFDAQRPILMKQILKKRIDTMLVYGDFLRQIPADRHGDLMANISQQFYDKQMKLTLEKNEVNSVSELDALLRGRGSSVQRLKRDFTEQVIAQQMVRQSADSKQEITHEQMLDYYQQRIAEYEFRAKATWEELMVEFRHYRNEKAALRDIAAMGNEVINGAPLSAVAKRSGQGPRHEEGGLYDWTTQGSLRSESLDEAIFSLPLEKLSQIIRDEQGFHIIRVIKREQAGRVPFTEAQVGIKEKIKDERRKKKLDEYIKKIREQTHVWTIFDEAAQPQDLAQP